MKLELTDTGYFREGRYDSKRFGHTLTVSVDKDSAVSDAYVEQCVEIVEKLSDADLLRLCEAAKRYCLAVIGLCGADGDTGFLEELPPVTAETPAQEMQQYFSLSELCADEPEADGQTWLRLTGSCDWEIEHGFEAAYRSGELIYVGAYEECLPSRAAYYTTGKGRAFNYA